MRPTEARCSRIRRRESRTPAKCSRVTACLCSPSRASLERYDSSPTLMYASDPWNLVSLRHILLNAAAEYAFHIEKSPLSTGMPLRFVNMTGGARYPPRLSREVGLVCLVYLVCLSG